MRSPFLDYVDLLHDATKAKTIHWEKSPEGYMRDVWYSARLNFKPLDVNQSVEFFDSRILFYASSSRYKPTPGRFECDFGGTFGVGSQEFYTYIELIASVIESMRSSLEREKNATASLCEKLGTNEEIGINSLYETDRNLLRFLLDATLIGKVCWYKVGMPDRRRMLTTVILPKSKSETKVKIRPVRMPMCNLNWKINKVPFLWVLEIPGRSIPFIMGTEGYRMLEEIHSVVKNRRSCRFTLFKALKYLNRLSGLEDTVCLYQWENSSSYEQDRLFLMRLHEATISERIVWKKTENQDQTTRGFSGLISLNRYWVESVNQIGADPLVLELKTSGHSIFTFWDTELGIYLSQILEFLWRKDSEMQDGGFGRKVDDLDWWNDNLKFRGRIQAARRLLLPDMT